MMFTLHAHFHMRTRHILLAGDGYSIVDESAHVSVLSCRKITDHFTQCVYSYKHWHCRVPSYIGNVTELGVPFSRGVVAAAAAASAQEMAKTEDPPLSPTAVSESEVFETTPTGGQRVDLLMSEHNSPETNRRNAGVILRRMSDEFNRRKFPKIIEEHRRRTRSAQEGESRWRAVVHAVAFIRRARTGSSSNH